MNKYIVRMASAACAGAFLLFAGAAGAAKMAGDNWADRVVIHSLPFEATVPDVQQATSEPADPELFCVNVGEPTRGVDTLWFEYATGAAEEYIDVDAQGYSAIVGVFAGSPADGYAMVRGGCNDDDYGGDAIFNSRILGLRLAPNTRYSIEVAIYPSHASAPIQLDLRVTPSTVWRVTKTADTDDGACDADCSLREALVATHTTPGAVVVPAGTYVLSRELRTLNGGGIYGVGMNGTIIDAAGNGRAIVHDTRDRNTLALHDLTLTGGVADGEGGAFYGRGDGYYAFDRVALKASRSTSGGGARFDSFSSVVSLFDSVVSGNTAAGDGGGVYFDGLSLEFSGTSLVGNRAMSAAGSGGRGGGASLQSVYAVRLKNATVSGNVAEDIGGGVYAEARSAEAEFVLNNSTIVNNESGGEVSTRNGGFVFAGNPPRKAPDVTNTVLAQNRSGNLPADCGKPENFVLTTGYDLVQSPNGCAFEATGDKTAADPRLQPLTTDTAIPVHVPVEGSPLLDAGDPGAGCERGDARGVVRPADGDADGIARCDIGAVEWTSMNRGDLIFADGFE